MDCCYEGHCFDMCYSVWSRDTTFKWMDLADDSYTIRETLINDVGLFVSNETLCLLMLQGVVGSWIRSVLTVDPYTAF